ncbi:MAG: AMP-binding protein [Spirochaetaceae bacterium]|jgi:long-chain acyl-CoA synthetase|nr:AMP-binding protein [Spirochaetaceae bacterium]
MLKPSDYIADWPDIPHANFVAWLAELDEKWQDKTAIFYRGDGNADFTRWSFSHFAAECRRIARGLLAAGLAKGDRVVLWSENRPEWMAVWMGTAIAGLTIVPVDFLVSEDECCNIIKITEARAFFYSERKKDFAASLAGRGLKMDATVCISPQGSITGAGAYAQFGTDAGAADTQLPGAGDIDAHDPVSIVFTSGTTGFAKGVTLHHKGIIANASAAIRSLQVLSSDIFINVLPLHHTYPTTCSFMAPLSRGAGTIIVERIVGKVIIDDIHDAGGTFLIAVPLLYEKFKGAIDSGYQQLPPVIRGPLDLLRKIALAKAKKGNFLFGQRALKVVRKKARLESIRIMVSGGGPLNPDTADFFDSLGFNMVQGYGMSENSPLISVSTPWHKNNASVGLPVMYTDAKIIDDVDDAGQSRGDIIEEGRRIGEIVVKSPSLMLGYYKNAEATAEMFTPDGYLRTGDIGYIDDDGFIYINGRKKSLIVSSGGKNIYPEEIEQRFDGSRIVGEILVVGRKDAGGGDVIFAVVYPNMEMLEQDHEGRKLDEALIKALVKAEIEKVNRSLPGYKKIADFTLVEKAFEKNAQQKIRRFMYKHYEKTT